MGQNGFKFYKSHAESLIPRLGFLIAVDELVVLKVTAQWKHRGMTNIDVMRGLMQRILDHQDSFTG